MASRSGVIVVIIISREIDLSVASIPGMSSALLGVLWEKHWPMLAIFVLVAVVGLAAGAVNGLLVTRAGPPSLAVTTCCGRSGSTPLCRTTGSAWNSM